MKEEKIKRIIAKEYNSLCDCLNKEESNYIDDYKLDYVRGSIHTCIILYSNIFNLDVLEAKKELENM